MRAFILIIALTLPIAACGKNENVEGNATGPKMTAEAIDSNDVTAIDAVTGEAANMAADVEFDANLANSLENAAANEAGSSRPVSRRPASPKPAPEPATDPAPADGNAA